MQEERMRVARIINMSKQFSESSPERDTMSDNRHIAPSLVGNLVINGPITFAFLSTPEDVMQLVRQLSSHREPHTD